MKFLKIKYLRFTLLILLITTSLTSKAHDDSHDHSENSHNEDNHSEDDHDKNTSHSHEQEDKAGTKQEHKHSVDEDHTENDNGSLIGPEKGILAKSGNGMKLAKEAMNSFQIKTISYSQKNPGIPLSALVEVRDHYFIYTLKEGWIKKIKVKVLKKTKDTVWLESSQWKEGEQIIIQGTGFIRVSELITEEGLSHGHSH